jgi:predicted nucleic acid-binding protein
MTLVDTSVWIDHFRKSDPRLVDLLHDGVVVSHPFVVGEVALGSFKHRSEILDLLEALPALDVVPHHEASAFVERYKLAGTGIGWIDLHLLAAAHPAGIEVLTNDARLRAQSARLRLMR